MKGIIIILFLLFWVFHPVAFSATLSFRQGQTGTGWSNYNNMDAAFVYLEAANTNYGSATTLATENDGTDSRHFNSYLCFTDLIGNDAGQIPVGAVITSATMYIKTHSATNSQSPNTVYSYRVTSNWSEGSITWNTQPAYNGTAISSFVPSALNTWYSFSVTSAVQAWANGSAPNYGIRLYNPGADWAQYFSDDDATLGNRPYLVVNYNPPVLSTSSTNFGNVRVGTSATASVTVTNTGSSGTTLSGSIGAASGSEFFPTIATQAFSLGQNQSSSRTYTYTPSAPGVDSTTISVTSNASNTNLTLTGTGVSPVFHSSFAPNSLIDFGSIENYTSNTIALDITNLASENLGDLTDLTLLNYSITGPDASYFSLENFTPGTRLSKDELLSLVLRATNPDAVNYTRYATLTIVTDVNAALGVEGNSYTYNLTAYMLPEPSSVFMGIFSMLFFLYRLYGKTKLQKQKDS